ncbi:hypothetical protein ACE6H2_015005 [Prunus campanulata]
MFGLNWLTIGCSLHGRIKVKETSLIGRNPQLCIPRVLFQWKSTEKMSLIELELNLVQLIVSKSSM